MHGGPWRNEPRGCAQEEVVGIPTPWPPGPVPFTLSFQRQKVRHPPGVPRSSVGDPCVPQILLQPRRAPGHTSQGSQGTLFLEVALPALCLPTVLLTHTYSQLPWGGRPGGERARFHLDPALREGFSEPGTGPCPASCLFPSGSQERGAGGGPIHPGSFLLPWNSSIGIT